MRFQWSAFKAFASSDPEGTLDRIVSRSKGRTLCIEYMNDRKTNARVFCGQDMSGPFTVLQPAQSGQFHLDVPLGNTVFIKVWETNTVFIKHHEPAKG